jgi:peroxiredoxin Q/BCP
MPKLQIGDKAPHLDKIISPEKLSGKKLVLYFYPKDNTPGCTAEACDLRDNYTELNNKNFVVAGISPDSKESHEKFSKKFELPFTLIPDTEKEILNAYGVWSEKSMYGKKYMGVVRQTFIINEKGIIEHIFEKVKTKEHTNQIFKELNIK